jgi:hypothetical protein
MTVFITPAFKNALEMLVRFFLGWSLCLLLAGTGTGAAAATSIAQVRAERADDGIYLSAQVQFELPPVVEDALLKGIPAFFVMEADIHRDRWYWSNLRVSSAARTVRLAYQPLTRRWRVNMVTGLITSSSGLRATLSQHYDTLPEALAAIQRVARWRIADATEVEADALYLLDFSFRLDLSQLPRPFQIGVAGQRDWTIAARVKDRLKLEPGARSMPPVPALVPTPAPAPAPAASAASAPPAASASTESTK